MRALVLHLTAFLLGASATAQGYGHVWIVDQQGSGDFTVIQDAVVAANPGDRVLVRDGAYPGFEVDGKSLAVEAAAGAHVEILGKIYVHDLLGIEWVVLRGLHTSGALVPAGQVATLLVTGGVGKTWVEDCSFGLPTGMPHIAEQSGFHADAALIQGGNAILVRSTFAGGGGVNGFPGGAGLHMATANVWVHASAFVGGPGLAPSGAAAPSPGGHGILQDGGFLSIAGSNARGGDGADAPDPLACTSGADGGDGIHLVGNSPVHEALDVAALGGSGGAGGSPTCSAPGLHGRARRVTVTGSITDHSGDAVGARLPSPAVTGTPLTLELYGAPGELVFFLTSAWQSVWEVPGAIGWQLIGDPVRIIGRLTLPASGTATVTYPTPTVGMPTAVSRSFYLQPIAVRPGAGGPVLVHGAPTVAGILSTLF